ncbi:MAG TPA: TraM recognition domain-containing protein [Streptosporangiaceae bacterium]|jgi:type IV secretory pathway TraG/TraD family ATPase VirD4
MIRANHTTVRPALLHTGLDYLIAVLAALFGTIAAGAWVTGEVAGILFRQRVPEVSPGQMGSIAVALTHHWNNPRLAWAPTARASLPGPAGFAVTAVVMLAGLVVAGWYCVRILAAHHSRQGLASRTQVQASLSPRSVVARGAVIRPSLARQKITLTDVGVQVGSTIPGRMPVAVSAEDSALVLAAPRQGKTSQVIIPWLHTWPGPALVTSIRPDVLLATATLRQARGPVAVMAPTGMISWPERLTWSPTTGCERFDKARARADVMVTVGKSERTSDSTDGGYFGLNATNLLAGWLHAAALAGKSASAVVDWAFDERRDDPIRILASHPQAASGTASMLDALYRLPPDTTRASLWTTAQTAIAPLLSPAARAVFTPPAGQGTDLSAFLRAGGTCYLMADERRAAALAPVISAFADDYIETAKTIADSQPGGRLDPPAGLFLDEVANIVPLPQLPALMSFAGGTGIFVTAVLQSLAQARNRWGRDAAEMLWGAATVKIILGGLAGGDLREISDLAGEYRETLTTWQRGRDHHSLQTTLHDRKAFTPGEVRTLPAHRREALVIHATTPAVRVRMTRHYEGPHCRQFAAAVERARGIAGLTTPEHRPATEAPQGEGPFTGWEFPPARTVEGARDARD